MAQIDPDIWKALEDFIKIKRKPFYCRERRKKIKKLFKL